MNNCSIALLCDVNSGSAVIEMARKMPVWVVSSDANDDLVRVARREIKDSRITIINRKSDERNIDLFVRSLYAIDEHHGEVSSSTPYSKIIVGGYFDEIPVSVINELKINYVIFSNYGFELKKFMR